MFEDIDKKTDNQTDQSTANPPKPAEDIFSDIKGFNEKKEEPSKNIKPKTKNGLIIFLSIILVVLVIIASGLFLVYKYLDISSLEQLKNKFSFFSKQEVTTNEEDLEIKKNTVIENQEENEIISTSTETVEETVEPVDTDGDGLSDAEENLLGTSIDNSDTDGDELLDGEEFNDFNTNPLVADSDNDGLSDYQEIEIYFTNPNDQDTDGDTYMDGVEVKAGYNPNGEGKINQ